jgi:hypothetical protein
VTEDRPREHPKAAFERLDKMRRRLDADAFTPSSVIERLVLQVIGGWELVKAEVAFHGFTAAGADGEWSPDNPAQELQKIATTWRVIHPREEFAAAAKRANDIRRRFAHLLALGDTLGEWPNRTLQFVRRGEPGESYGKRREKIGLKWRSDEWSMQAFHQDSLAEQELHDVLAMEQWMIHVCRAVAHIHAHLDESPDLPDDHKISDGEWWSVFSGGWWVPWVLHEWQQEQKTELYVRDVRLPDDAARDTSPN